MLYANISDFHHPLNQPTNQLSNDESRPRTWLVQFSCEIICVGQLLNTEYGYPALSIVSHFLCCCTAAVGVVVIKPPRTCCFVSALYFKASNLRCLRNCVLKEMYLNTHRPHIIRWAYANESEAYHREIEVLSTCVWEASIKGKPMKTHPKNFRKSDRGSSPYVGGSHKDCDL